MRNVCGVVRRLGSTVFYVLLIAVLVVAAMVCLMALDIADGPSMPPNGGPGYVDF